MLTLIVGIGAFIAGMVAGMVIEEDDQKKRAARRASAPRTKARVIEGQIVADVQQAEEAIRRIHRESMDRRSA